ncbi:hypothetical protein REC12_16515 [Desulfosporosinus sp. PR]|uniref:hypothetical protein n=1 Tax=Candidatus Desulfosporosinus nitrosoreducens TaxID=3401928 RepID=UPI0027FA7543|nr:hypothetical protein [Desulfosporosinus sp. PR]MDQ7095202.1 hypothetical protein [Desulfosporosinus sp. PR]
MYDLVDYRKTKKKYVQDFPEGILDVIEAAYPSKYRLLAEDPSLMTALFSNEEWTDILTKSRNSYSDHIQRLIFSQKKWAQGI